MVAEYERGRHAEHGTAKLEILQSLLSFCLQTVRDVTGIYVITLDLSGIGVWVDKPFEGSGILRGRPPHPLEIRESTSLSVVRTSLSTGVVRPV